ncbi:MAG: glycosyltransferase family 4 protein [Geobacter sp.]|nr:MAG: glycosyltransferase family 4 protein [Geobacter sp.]
MGNRKEGKFKILLVVRWPVGGIRTFINYVYKTFDHALFEVSILCPGLPEVDLFSETLKAQGVRLIKLSPSPSFVEFSVAVVKAISFGNYDVIHSHGFTSGFLAALPAFVFRRPHLLTSHDVLNKAQFSGMLGRLNRLSLRLFLSMIGTIHSVSQDAQDNFLEYFPQLKDRCLVIRNGIDVDAFSHARPTDLHRQLQLDKDYFLVGFLGRFMKQKGFACLADAIDILRARKLEKTPVVVAFGEGGFIREEQAALKARGLSDHFRFMPFTTDVAGVITGLDLIAMPSLWEACPLLAMETLACGTPLVASNCIGLKEVVVDTPAYIVEAGDAKALADGIEYFIHTDRTDQFRKFKREARGRFDVGKQAARIQELLVSMADSRAGGSG